MSSSGSNGVMFQLKVDPLTGNSEWIVIQEQEPEQEDDLLLTNNSKQLLANTCYLDMLNDTPRNTAYRNAIDSTLSKHSLTHTNVLDIGSGTGLLSMMAARAMGISSSSSSSTSQGTVTACESYLPMLKLMKKVLRANNMDGKIRLFNKRSDELQVAVDMASRADVLVSEILDSELLGEGLIPTLQHAHDNLLVQGYKTVPYKATTYGQLVESTHLWKLHDLFSNEANAADGIRLVPNGKETILRVKQQQYAMHCDAMSQEIQLLSEPFKIFEYDFSKRPDSHGETQLHINATNDGTVHAVVSWWVIGIGVITGNNVSGSAKGKISEADHHDSRPQDSHITLSPERIAIYGDKYWRRSMLDAINHALKEKDAPLCVIADDSVFLTLAVAHLSKTSHIISLFPGLREKGTQYLQTVADENGYSMDRLEVISPSKKQWTMNDTHQKKVDLLIAEPFYVGAEGMLPWQGLQFWSKRTMLDSILSEDVCIMPCKGILKACAMSLPDLWRSRRALENIEGFDHTMVNSTLGACGGLSSTSDSPCLPFYIWQCGDGEFDLLKPLSSCQGKAKVEFTEAGVCHGFALWIDWVMDSTNDIVMSTGPDHRYWKQGVKLLGEPLMVGKNVSGICSTVIEASFDSSSGELLTLSRNRCIGWGCSLAIPVRGRGRIMCAFHLPVSRSDGIGYIVVRDLVNGLVRGPLRLAPWHQSSFPNGASYRPSRHKVSRPLREQEAGGSGSDPRRTRTYIPREREEAEQRSINDYFCDDETLPKYPEENFRRSAYPPYANWAYSTAPDAFDEYLQIAERCSRQCLENFTKCIQVLYVEKFLRKPTSTDIEKTYELHEEKHGLTRMLGSIDCMHWEWRNGP
nr:protein arginine N-methyltransferase 1.6 [Tanacetum cinerariifolium]